MSSRCYSSTARIGSHVGWRAQPLLAEEFERAGIQLEYLTTPRADKPESRFLVTFTGQDVALLTRIDPENNTIQRDDRDGQSGAVRKKVSKNCPPRLGIV